MTSKTAADRQVDKSVFRVRAASYTRKQTDSKDPRLTPTGCVVFERLQGAVSNVALGVVAGSANEVHQRDKPGGTLSVVADGGRRDILVGQCVGPFLEHRSRDSGRRHERQGM